ncbi:MAG: response regulator [Nitrosopumilus sp.]
MSYSVLVADDSAFMRTFLSKIFKNTANVREIFEVKNGIEVLKMYKIKKPDLVTMDIDMPELNGIEAAKQIKLFDPNAKIVIVSSSDKTNTRAEARDVGVHGYITKPFDRLEIKKQLMIFQRNIDFYEIMN